MEETTQSLNTTETMNDEDIKKPMSDNIKYKVSDYIRYILKSKNEITVRYGKIITIINDNLLKVYDLENKSIDRIKHTDVLNKVFVIYENNDIYDFLLILLLLSVIQLFFINIYIYNYHYDAISSYLIYTNNMMVVNYEYAVHNLMIIQDKILTHFSLKN